MSDSLRELQSGFELGQPNEPFDGFRQAMLAQFLNREEIKLRSENPESPNAPSDGAAPSSKPTTTDRYVSEGEVARAAEWV
ncbi:MAG: hypothetical protein FJ403_04155 [Verrucomicrobia bacterium]|nr:hypothetical protein [Verrucomicrobiota bacterium]